jgi:hypothetical protein
MAMNIRPSVATSIIAGLVLLLTIQSVLQQQQLPRGTARQQPSAHTYVVLSTGSAPLYSFFLPLAALSWSRRQQFVPIILLVQDAPGAGQWDGDAQTAVILKYLHMWGFEKNVYLLGYNSSLPHNSATVSQVARAYVAGLCGVVGPVKEALHADAYIVTTDVDIVAIASSSYFLPSNSSYAGKVTNAFCCGTSTLKGVDYREYPMSTIAMNASTWRSSLKFGCLCNGTSQHGCLSQSLPGFMNRHLMEVFGYGSSNMIGTQWSMDQRLVSYHLHTEGAVKLELINRQPSSDRIDRSNWPDGSWSSDRLQAYVDAHVLRPGYTTGNWARLRLLYQQVMLVDETRTTDKLLWQQVEEYVLDYQAALMRSPATSSYQLVPDSEKG